MYQNRQRQLACWVLQLRHSKRCWQFDSRVVLEGVWDANHRLQVPDWAPFREAWVVVLTLAGTTCSLSSGDCDGTQPRSEWMDVFLCASRTISRMGWASDGSVE